MSGCIVGMLLIGMGLGLILFRKGWSVKRSQEWYDRYWPSLFLRPSVWYPKSFMVLFGLLTLAFGIFAIVDCWR